MSHTTKFIDVTLRDGHQSLAATRMSTEQILRVLKMTNDAGYQRLELWGGAVLDSCIRFLNEDPWERLEKFKEVLGGGQKIRALLRGQNLFGYEPSSDDLVIAFEFPEGFLHSVVQQGNVLSFVVRGHDDRDAVHGLASC